MFINAMKIKNNSLPKNKIIKSKKTIDRLFQEGNSLHKYPIRLVFSIEKNESKGYKTAFFVPKKKFKKAVDRNRIKRLMREAFRLQQNQLNKNLYYNLIWIYTGRELPDFYLVYKKIEQLLEALKTNGTT